MFILARQRLAVAGTAWRAVARLIEVLPGRNVPVLVPFVGETAELPIGPGGAPAEVVVDQAIVTVPQPAAATQFALVAEPIVVGLTIIAAIALLGVVCWNLARGHAFARANVRLIVGGAFVLLGGWFVGVDAHDDDGQRRALGASATTRTTA